MTKVAERWFPGAHSDVGGGYGDPDGLPALSYGWMLSHLENSYTFKSGNQKVSSNPLAMSHWSIGDWPGNIRSRCENRIIPAGADIDPSVQDRTGVRARIRKEGKVEFIEYPLGCGSISADEYKANSGYYLRNGPTYRVRLIGEMPLYDKGIPATYSGWSDKDKADFGLYQWAKCIFRRNVNTYSGGT